MNSTIYGRIVRPANLAPDGETPTVILVTKENNGFAVFKESCEGGIELIKFFVGDGPSIRADAIEHGVKLATGK